MKALDRGWGWGDARALEAGGRELFEAAGEQETAGRAEFLARAATGDAALAEQVLRLLAPDKNAGAFLDNSPGLGSSPVGDGRFAAKLEVLVAHGLALTRLGRAKEAEAPLRDALAWREANMDENSPMLAESLIALAECYSSQDERAECIHRSHANLGEHFRAPLRKIEQRLAAR